MGKRRKPLSLFITDNGVAFFGGNPKDENDIVYDQEALPEGTVEFGYIKDPHELLRVLKGLWKKNNIKPRYVRLVIQDQNILVRELTIEKKKVKKTSISEYFKERLGDEFHVPFDTPVISHMKVEETDKNVRALLYIADENLLQDYYDVMEKLGIKDVIFDLAVSALMELIIDEKQEKAILLTTLYDEHFSIQIIEDGYLIFGIIEDISDYAGEYLDKVEIFIERIANYYRYNLRDGDRRIDKTIVGNLNDHMGYDKVRQKLIPNIDHLNAEMCSLKEHMEFLREKPKGIIVAYASNQILEKRHKEKKIIDFTLDRINPLTMTGYYLLVVAVAIFALMTIIYIPYQNHQRTINDLTSENIALNDRLTTLNNDIQAYVNESPSSPYDDAFKAISSSRDQLPIDPFLDLENELDGDLLMTDYVWRTDDKTIILIIDGSTRSDVYAYILAIYEQYGGEDGWMPSAPTYVFRSDTVAEVTVRYA